MAYKATPHNCFRDDALIMAFVRSGLGVTVSQELVLQAFGSPGVASRPLKPACYRTPGLAFSKTVSSVVSRMLLEYLQRRRRGTASVDAALRAGDAPKRPTP